LNELIECEKLFKDYAKKIATQKSGIAAMTGEDIYQFYLGLKHQFHSAGTAFSDAIPQVIKNIGWGKFVAITSVFLTSLIKSIPVAAAEIVADFGIEKLDQHAHETEDLMNKLLSTFSSSILKLMLLVPKGLGAAITTPFPERSNAFIASLQLPVNMVANFIEAEGYNEAILNDWKEMAEIISNLMQINNIDNSNIDINQGNTASSNVNNNSSNASNQTSNDQHGHASSSADYQSHDNSTSSYSGNESKNNNVASNFSNEVTADVSGHQQDDTNDCYGTRASFNLNFNHNGQHYNFNASEGLEINISNKSTGVVSTQCYGGRCLVDIKLDHNTYTSISVPYKTNSYNNASNKERMQEHLNNLNTSRQNVNNAFSSTRVKDYSSFTNQTRQTHYTDTADEANWRNTFNKMNVNYQQRPAPKNNGWSSFFGSDGQGGRGYCDQFGNCSSSNSDNCRSAGSGDRCRSRL